MVSGCKKQDEVTCPFLVNSLIQSAPTIQKCGQNQDTESRQRVYVNHLETRRRRKDTTVSLVLDMAQDIDDIHERVPLFFNVFIHDRFASKVLFVIITFLAFKDNKNTLPLTS